MRNYNDTLINSCPIYTKWRNFIKCILDTNLNPNLIVSDQLKINSLFGAKSLLQTCKMTYLNKRRRSPVGAMGGGGGR